MSKPLIVYWSSNSGGTKRAAERLKTKTVELKNYDGTTPYIIMSPSFDQPRGGFTPKPVEQFLGEHAANMIGVLPTGNLNFGEYFCQSGRDISSEHGVPIVYRVDLPGNAEDCRNIDSGIEQHWHTLLHMRGLT